MTEPLATCQHVDVALLMQQMIREREAADTGAAATMTIGDACGEPAIGSVELDGERHHFCAGHVLEGRILRS